MGERGSGVVNTSGRFSHPRGVSILLRMALSSTGAGAVRSRMNVGARLRSPAATQLVVAAVCLLPVLMTARFLFEPLTRDEAVYATIANGLLHGQVPYRDLFDQKPPLIYGWYLLSFFVFGEHDYAPRLLGVIVLMLTSLMLFFAGKELASRRAGLVAATIFGISTGAAAIAPWSNVEPFMLLPLTASLAAYARGRGRGDRWVLLAGALAGIALMTKPVAVFNVAALGIDILWDLRRGDIARRRVLKRAVLYGGGVACVAGAIVLPFVVVGAMREFVYSNITYNQLYAARYSAGTKFAAGIRNGLAFLIATAPLVFAAAVAVVLAMRRRSRSRMIVVGWLVASALAVASPGRFYGHYFIQLLPALALVIGMAASELRGVLRVRFAGPACAGAMIGLTFITLRATVPFYAPATPAARASFRDPGPGGVRQAGARAIGLYLRAHTNAGDRVFVWGRESEIYFYSGRTPATRFLFDQPFWVDPATLAQAIAQLRAHPPAYIADTMAGELAPQPDPARPAAFQQLLSDLYTYVGREEFADIYVLKPGGR